MPTNADQGEVVDGTKQTGRSNKKPYTRPSLVVYGSIAKLTQNGNGSGLDGNTVPGMTMGLA